MHRISIQRSGTTFDVAPDETILAAAARNGVWLSHRCRNGSCGSCLARMVSGRVRHRVAPTAEMGADDVCLCVAYALSPVVIDVVELAQPQRHVRRVPARIKGVESRDAGATLLHLRIPASAISTLAAGQAVRLIAPAAAAGSLEPMRFDPDAVVVAWRPDGAGEAQAPGVPKIGEVVQIEFLA